MSKICFSSGKKRYSTEKEAQKIILLQDVSLKSYFCKDCNGWHLTKDNR